MGFWIGARFGSALDARGRGKERKGTNMRELNGETIFWDGGIAINRKTGHDEGNTPARFI